MNWVRQLFSHHVLANLVFALVLSVGTLSFLQLPREQDPEINFNWIDITTIVPGMAASDVEKRVTDILEDGIRKVSDIKFVSSNSRENFSNILVRFNDIDERLFDKRLNDLRREIDTKQSELPDEAEDPFIFEVTTANAYPTASIIVSAESNDENLRYQSENIKKDLERIKGVDRILDVGLVNPELQVQFDPKQLQSLGVSPKMVADTVSLYYRDVSAGSLDLNEDAWLVRMTGTSANPDYLASLPIIGAKQEVRLGDVATVVRGHDEARHKISLEGKPGVMLSVTKQAGTNTLTLVERITQYIEEQNKLQDKLGVKITLADDSTDITRNALSIMQTNAGVGLLLVLVVAWIFLGFRIALLTAIGIPFILAGTFWALQGLGQTLNVTVLLGVVISLGMLVDDAVVIVEGIFYRLQRGMSALDAAVDALEEVFAPVTAAVLTTIAAFLPLMLLPGILGEFMKVVPMVVTIALAMSLVEAYWMLPSHISAANIDLTHPNRMQRWRANMLHSIRLHYTRWLTRSLRWPKTLFSILIVLFLLAMVSSVGTVAKPELQTHPVWGKFFVKRDFFASDPLRLFYINLEMPPGTPLDSTLKTTVEFESQILQYLKENEKQTVASWAGQMFTETAPYQGEQYGQIMVVLNDRENGMRSVDDVIESIRPELDALAGPVKKSFLRIAGGPPVSKAISVKIRGDKLDEIRAATADLTSFINTAGWAKDLSDDDAAGLSEMVVRMKPDMIRRNGLDPATVMANIRLLVDGNIVASMQDQGETLDVRVKALQPSTGSIESILDIHIPTPSGAQVPLLSLIETETQLGFGNIRHYDFKRTITLEADLSDPNVDTLNANAQIKTYWENARERHPNISLDFSGQLDDLNEALGSIARLMLFGVLLMYAILGTQFKSYLQPLMILLTVPMAFTGVVVGLLITGNPLSLYTLYGVVALAGIAVNAAIVLISAANARLDAGMSVLHATIYAARRRVVPILITSLTTIAGLFSLATGLGGTSLLWGPVATAIVWGLMVSTGLTLFTIPLLYRIFMPRSHLAKKHALR